MTTDNDFTTMAKAMAKGTPGEELRYVHEQLMRALAIPPGYLGTRTEASTLTPTPNTDRPEPKP